MMNIRELTTEEQMTYDRMVEGAKQINILGIEEELDAKDYIFRNYADEDWEE